MEFSLSDNHKRLCSRSAMCNWRLYLEFYMRLSPIHTADADATRQNSFVSKERWGVPISPSYILLYILFLYQQSFARNFRLQFWVGAANPQFWGRGGHRGSGMVPFERALMSFYRPSIELSSVFTCFRDVAAFVLQHATFSLPHL